MNRIECETLLKNKIVEAVQILKEYDPTSDYLILAYFLNDDGQHKAKAHNEAFKNDDVKTIDLNTEVSKVEPIKAKDYDVDVPNLYTFEEFLAIYDEVVTQVLQLVGKDNKSVVEYVFYLAILRTRLEEAFK